MYSSRHSIKCACLVFTTVCRYILQHPNVQQHKIHPLPWHDFNCTVAFAMDTMKCMLIYVQCTWWGPPVSKWPLTTQMNCSVRTWFYVFCWTSMFASTRRCIATILGCSHATLPMGYDVRPSKSVSLYYFESTTTPINTGNTLCTRFVPATYWKQNTFLA